MAIERDAEVRIDINDQAATDKIKKLEAQTVELRKAFREAFAKGDTKGMEQVTKELNKVNKQLANARTNAQNIQAAMVRLNQASPKELNRTIKMINAELNSGRVVRGTKEWDAYVAKLKEAKRELKKVNDEMKDSEGLFTSLKDGVNDWGATAAAAVAAFAGVVMSGREAVKAYAEMQQEEANVRKYTGMTEEQIRILNEEFKKIDTRAGRDELNRLAQEAGRLGKTSVEDVLGFVKAANQINVALDDLGDGATLELSKLTGIFGDEARLGTEKSLLAVGSVINELSQNCTASAPYLADFSKRLAGVGAQAKLTVPQIMAYAAVLDTQGQAVEMSATAFSQLILKLYKDPAKMAKAAGLDVKNFTNLLKADANEAVLTLLESLNKMGNIEALAPIFSDMGMDGARASGVMAALAGNIDAVRSQQAEANKAFTEGVSITKEYNVQNTTVQAGLDKAKKGFQEITIELGEKLVPVMGYAISGTSMLIKVMKTIVDFIIKYKGAIITTAAALTSYYIAANWAIIKTKLLAGWTATAKAAKIAYAAATKLAAAAVYLLSGNVSKATTAFKAFSAVIKASPVGAFAAALTALVGGFVALGLSQDKAAKKQQLLNSHERDAIKLVQDEITNLRVLYERTQNQKVAMDDRLDAVQQLQDLYPDYFKNLSKETILAGNAKSAYDELTKSILATAKAEGRKSAITSLEKDIIDLEAQYKDEYNELFNDLMTKGAIFDTGEEVEGEINKYPALMVKFRLLKAVYADVIEEKKALQKELTEEVAVSMPTAPKTAPIEDVTTPFERGETEKERKKREAAEAKALKKSIDQVKAARDKENAINLAAYSMGEITRQEYLDRELAAETKAIDEQLALLQKYHKEDSDEYSKLEEDREKLKAKYSKENLKLTLKELEAEAEMRKQILTEAYFDPSSSIFGDEKAYRQGMLDEDLRYLNEKKELYAEKSLERLEVEREIENRLADDKLQKQKETAEAYQRFIEQYRNSSGSEQEQRELDLLKSLLDKKLISQQEYEKAVKDIKDKSLEEDEARHRKVKSEYADMVKDLYTAFNDLFKSIGKGGEEMWKALTDSAAASFAVMSAGLQQYSAYSNAERDLELAKANKYYENEIEKAGDDTKLKEKLEAEKEKKTAAIKKKYNDRAMKVELAQAIAQTAQAAIAAYASAAAIPVTGWIMAPIAAALATAAGMVQIATIKKQHEAEAAGYYEGGYTGGKQYKREAGVVHEGEFVANHQAVNNPAIAPVLRLIDYAQKNNTVAQLTAEDVSNALGRVNVTAETATPQSGTALKDVEAGLAVASGVMRSAGSAIDRLNRRLDAPIEAVVTIDGENGLHKKYTQYQKLINNGNR